ncbi:hypothetical protein CLOM_g22299 [Closterium sp. NIES-68]|nr:hypothetical protein CLOM_g22299 [Closterium sp. NIES-68]GJP64426.1 hypothetical protein CLOP_g21420 [Closterium sp. NIES-67]
MAPYWDNQMEYVTAVSASPNPYPPLGRKPRPSMLAIPDISPPPLSPTPLFFFQQSAPKRQPQQPPQQALPQPPPQPQPQDRRRRRLWRDDPEPPRASAPVAGLPEPAEAVPGCGSRLNGGMVGAANFRGRNMGMGMGHGISLSAGGMTERKQSSALMRSTRFATSSAVAEHAVTVSQQQLLSQILGHSEFPEYDLQSPNVDRRYRESCGCSVDTSSLWSSLISLVCPEPAASSGPVAEPHSAVCDDVVLDIPEFVVNPKTPLVAGSGGSFMVKDAVPVSREAAAGPSPMSVLTPTASEPSPTQPLAPFVW